jgi:histone H3/H4
MTKSLIVRFQVKDAAQIAEKKINVTEDFYTELERKVKSIIEESVRRAQANNRTTVMGRDV